MHIRKNDRQEFKISSLRISSCGVHKGEYIKAEGLGGSALHYGMLARRAPGIVLILEDYESDYKYFMRLMLTVKSYNRDVRVFPVFVDGAGEPYEVWP